MSRPSRLSPWAVILAVSGSFAVSAQQPGDAPQVFRGGVDLVVVEAAPFGPKRSRHKEMVRLYHAVAGFPVAADVLVYSRDDVDYWRDSLNHVLARALREGKVLYERR